MLLLGAAGKGARRSSGGVVGAQEEDCAQGTIKVRTTPGGRRDNGFNQELVTQK